MTTDGTGTATPQAERSATRVTPRPPARALPRRHPRRVVAVAALLLVAFACIDVLDLTQSHEWLDASSGPHMAAVTHARTTPAVTPGRRATPARHAVRPEPLLLVTVLVLLELVLLPRSPDRTLRRPGRPRPRGPPAPRLVGAHP